MKDYIGFTLAEVLITLLIIGIVASLVIPNLINDTNKQEYVVALKKSYSDLNQATKLLLIDYVGDLLNGPFGHGVSSNDLNAFVTKLNITKICAGAGTSGCWHTGAIKWLNGTYSGYNISSGGSKAILSDGASISFLDYGNSCNTSRGKGPLSNTCGYIIVDVNGPKNPNTFGRDEFMFWITRTGLFPFGCSYDTSQFIYCASSDSQGCAAKVLQEGAENY